MPRWLVAIAHTTTLLDAKKIALELDGISS